MMSPTFHSWLMILSNYFREIYKFFQTTILDINLWTYVKYGQKVLFRERAKSAYFRSASSDSNFVALHTRLLLDTLTSFKSIEKSIGLSTIYEKTSSNYACGEKSR